MSLRLWAGATGLLPWPPLWLFTTRVTGHICVCVFSFSQSVFFLFKVASSSLPQADVHMSSNVTYVCCGETLNKIMLFIIWNF